MMATAGRRPVAVAGPADVASGRRHLGDDLGRVLLRAELQQPQPQPRLQAVDPDFQLCLSPAPHPADCLAGRLWRGAPHEGPALSNPPSWSWAAALLWVPTRHPETQM